ncbi:Hsp20/alpha crystallin family protein [bacterium]|nr:Hsp20/alpha crystallin family protein [bacterium]
MADEKKKEGKINIDFGLGGLFKGLGDLLEVAQNLAEKGQEFSETQSKVSEMKSRLSEVQGKVFEETREFKGKGPLKDLSGVYGVKVRFGGLGGGGEESRDFTVEPFGNIKQTPEGPVVEEIREPLFDIFEEEDTIQVIAELPGVHEDKIEVEVKGDILNISAEDENRKYSKELLLPSQVKEETMAKSYQNGILEVKLEKA